MNLRSEVRRLIDQNEIEQLGELIASNPRTVRYLLGFSYLPDEALRRRAARGIAIASNHHQKLVGDLIRRLVWAMNDESGTNAVTAPEVVRAIAEENPELLLPMVPDLFRLSADEGLREGLGEALRLVSKGCPGKVGKELQKSLNQMLLGGECDAN
jgi:hypothetical protein